MILNLSDPAFVARLTTSGSVTPASYGTLAGWWKADSFALSDADPIGGTGVEWTDQSGVGNHLTQASSGARPLFKTNIFGSQPAIRFDGADDELTIPTAITPTNWTIVGVCKNIAADSMLLGSSTSSFQVRIMRSAANTVSYYDGANDNVSQTLGTTAASARMTSWRRDGSNNLLFRENTTDRSPGQTTSVALSVNRVGRTSYGQFFSGDMGEIVIWSTSLTNTQLDDLYNSYFKPKWGLP